MAKRPSAAQIAYGPMVLVAVEQHTSAAQRLVEDALAVRFLPLRPRLLVAACRRQFVRNRTIRASEEQVPGIWGCTLCRKRYADDQVIAAVAAGLRQVVILGAGVDTKAYRLVAPTGGVAFEVDRPANIAYKQERLQAIYGRVPDHVALVPVDFETDDLAAVLATRGFHIGHPAMFVWEAITQYLTDDSVRKTSEFLARATPGSRLIFAYVSQDVVDVIHHSGAAGLNQTTVIKHPIYRYGIAPEHVVDRLRQSGWAEREQVGPAEFIQRYVEPTGRDLAVYELERFVSAEKV